MSIFQDHEKSRDKLGNLTTLMLHPRGLLTAFSLAKNDFRKNWKSSSLPTIPHKHLHQSARIYYVSSDGKNGPKYAKIGRDALWNPPRRRRKGATSTVPKERKTRRLDVFRLSGMKNT